MPGKKFKFAFENVLKLRHHETEQAQQSLRDAVAERERQEALLHEAKCTLQDMVTASPAGTSADPRVLKRFDSFRRNAQRVCADAQRVLDQKQDKEQEAMNLLLARRRAEEALANLKDQQQQAHQREMEALDLAFIDETALSGYTRKNEPGLNLRA